MSESVFNPYIPTTIHYGNANYKSKKIACGQFKMFVPVANRTYLNKNYSIKPNEVTCTLCIALLLDRAQKSKYSPSPKRANLVTKRLAVWEARLKELSSRSDAELNAKYQLVCSQTKDIAKKMARRESLTKSIRDIIMNSVMTTTAASRIMDEVEKHVVMKDE